MEVGTLKLRILDDVKKMNKEKAKKNELEFSLYEPEIVQIAKSLHDMIKNNE